MTSEEHDEEAGGTGDASELRLAAPRNQRELFLLLGELERGEKLENIVSCLNTSGVLPRQVYYSVHGHPPERIRGALASDYSAQRHYLAALMSQEFQTRVIANFLNAFPEKRRRVFVHVPKCAGSDLANHLSRRFLALPHRLTSGLWTSKDELFRQLSDAARSVRGAQEVLVYGHIPLREYVDSVGTRLDDDVFAVIRDPTEIAISQANYAVTLIVRDPEGRRPDTRRNLDLLGLECLPRDPGPEVLKELALRAFLDKRITQPNLISWYLGAGGRTHHDAIRNIIIYDIEITDTKNYNAWLTERWKIESSTRENSSLKFLSRADVAPYAKHLDEIAGEDNKIFELLSWALSVRDSFHTGYRVAAADP